MLLGTNFTITLGVWRLRFVLALEDVEERPPAPAPERPHHVTLKQFTGVN